MKKIRISLTPQELSYLEHILYHFVDYMAHDDRPDHGMGILKQYRDMDSDAKSPIYFLAGKLRRAYRRHQQKQQTDDMINKTYTV